MKFSIQIQELIYEMTANVMM